MSYLLIAMLMLPGWFQDVNKDYIDELLSTQMSLELRNVRTLEIIKTMKRQYSIPISFIDNMSQDRKPDDFVCVDCSLKDVLIKLTSSGLYSYSVINEHLILYSNEAKYRETVKNVRIGEKERLDAVLELTKKIRNDITGFVLYGPILLGNPDIPLYTEKVTIESKDKSVLNCLVQVLGDNKQVYFSVTAAGNGLPFMNLGMIRTKALENKK